MALQEQATARLRRQARSCGLRELTVVGKALQTANDRLSGNFRTDQDVEGA
jgi:hypothetical protein